MDNIEIWRQLLERYPTWIDAQVEVTLRARGLKALLDQAYECGLESAKESTEAAYSRGFKAGVRMGEAKASLGKDTGVDIMGLFDKILKEKF